MRSLLPALALLAICIGVAPAHAMAPGTSEAAPATRAWAVDADTWRIVARVEFFGAGLPPGRAGEVLIGWWMRGVERHWNRHAVVDVAENGRTRRVRLQFRVEASRRASDAPPRPDAHQIEVVRTLPELTARLRGRDTRLMDGYRSWVRPARGSGPAQGCWANLAWPTVIAHEFGHIWGLDDEYDRESGGLARYFRDFPPREWPPSLMDWSWLPLSRAKPRHFQAIWERICTGGRPAPARSRPAPRRRLI